MTPFQCLCRFEMPLDIAIILFGNILLIKTSKQTAKTAQQMTNAFAKTDLVTELDIKADVLVSLALIVSVCISEDFTAEEAAFIMQFGALLEEFTVAKIRAGIEKLVHLTPQTARIINGGTEKIIPAEQVKINDLLRILPSETVPMNERATWIVVIALTAIALTWVISSQIISAVTILVVFALVLWYLRYLRQLWWQSVTPPNTILLFVRKMLWNDWRRYRKSPLIKRKHLLTAPAGNQYCWTFHKKSFMLSVLLLNNYPNIQLVTQLLSAINRKGYFSHRVIQNDFGMRCFFYCKWKNVLAGNREIFAEQNIEISDKVFWQAKKFLMQGCMMIYVAINQVLAGYIVLSDTVREESATMISDLTNLNVQPVLLTGILQ